MTRYILGNFKTGRDLVDIPVISGPWSNTLLEPESMSVEIDTRDPDTLSLDLRNRTRAGQSMLAVVENNRIMAVGPIWTSNWDMDAGVLSLQARGVGSYFNHRHILPTLATTIPVNDWTVVDPLDAKKAIPNPRLNTTLSGVSFGTMAKRILQQSQEWTGGNIPLVFQDDEISSRTKTYLGLDFKPVWEALEDLMMLIGGPEISIDGRFTEDEMGIEYVVRTGTEARPMLFADENHIWDLTAGVTAAYGLQINEDASNMASLAWQTGGRQGDSAMVATAFDRTLTDANYALLESLDSSHSSVSDQATLDNYASADAFNGRLPEQSWSFKAEAYPVDETGPYGPIVGTYYTGDFCTISLPKYSEDGTGDTYHANGGNFNQRIVGLSGDHIGEEIGVQCAPSLEQI